MAETHALLDLRERAAYERGHIFRATALPRRLLEFRLPQLVTGRATPLVLCDDDGAMSGLAAPTLAAMGYTDVRILQGGLQGWRAAGRPLVQGLNVESKVFGEQMLRANKTPQIGPHELKKRIDAGEDMVIVDSRTPEEYHRGCVPGSVSMPGGELVLRITELVKNPEQTIVVHCGGRTRSYIGAESVRRLGLPNPVIALENGTMGWQLAGLELERGAARWAPSISERGRSLAEPLATRVAADEKIAFVDAPELRGLWDRRHAENLNILDVRTTDEYAAGHVAGSVWAPGGQAVQGTDEYVAVRTARIVLVCDTTSRSVMTASWLTPHGLPACRRVARWSFRVGGRRGSGRARSSVCRPRRPRRGAGVRRGHQRDSARRRVARGPLAPSPERRPERRVRASARARRGVALPQPARAAHLRRSARARGAHCRHLQRRRRFESGRRHPRSPGLHGGTRVGGGHAGLGRGAASPRSRARHACSTKPTTWC